MIPFSPLVQSVPSKEVSKASCLPSVAATASSVVTTYLPTYYYSFLCMYDDGLSISQSCQTNKSYFKVWEKTIKITQ